MFSNFDGHHRECIRDDVLLSILFIPKLVMTLDAKSGFILFDKDMY